MFPDELKQFNQWVVRRADKVPINPRTGYPASPIDPAQWSDYATAAAVCTVRPEFGLGFVLTKNDPYTFIDLDAPNGDPNLTPEQKAAIVNNQQLIFKAFNSYSELSPSKHGLHILVRGSVPDGKRRSKVEVYSDARYMTVTGDTYHDVPIAERQELLDQLWKDMGGNENENAIIPSTHLATPGREINSDELIKIQASSAVNGAKFDQLFRGEWNTLYGSQSEADFALIDIISFYTNDVDQIDRIFKSSGLGARDKANRAKYVRTMIQRSFDRKQPTIDLDVVAAQVTEDIRKMKVERIKVPEIDIEWTVPPGLVGEIATFIYQSANRQIKEVALIGAIAFMAGLTGRAFNISGTGLNQYLVLLAETGVGKEAAATGINKLVAAIEPQCPSILDYIGPNFASPQGLIRHLSNHSQSFCVFMGEIGLWLQNICSKWARGNELGMRKILLELYNKSGDTNVFSGVVHSDSKKDAKKVPNPNFTLFGESTPDSFYRALDEANIQEGFLPRFTVIEYNGKRPRNNEHGSKVKPDPNLVTRLGNLTAMCSLSQQQNKVWPVDMDDEAREFARKFDIECDDRINNSEEGFTRELWNRAHLKMLKLAALIAVGVQYQDPKINLQQMKWAHQLVVRGVNTMTARFEAGEIGETSLSNDQHKVLVRALRHYKMNGFTETLNKTYGITKEMFDLGIITQRWIQNRVRSARPFQKDRNPAQAFKQCLMQFVDAGYLVNCNLQVYGKSGLAYYVRDLANMPDK